MGFFLVLDISNACRCFSRALSSALSSLDESLELPPSADDSFPLPLALSSSEDSASDGKLSLSESPAGGIHSAAEREIWDAALRAALLLDPARGVTAFCFPSGILSGGDFLGPAFFGGFLAAFLAAFLADFFRISGFFFSSVGFFFSSVDFFFNSVACFVFVSFLSPLLPSLSELPGLPPRDLLLPSWRSGFRLWRDWASVLSALSPQKYFR
mmetsp:Transcript_13104/g.28446  ORF Transcript_13104/g.28446 Transcript_13104/m.28446 type:complete len:212 (+) Transcript_13104:3320-3955(+)